MIPGPASADAEILLALHTGLTRRPMPETVAGLVARLSPVAADPSLRAALKQASASRSACSAMMETWFEAVPPRCQIVVALDLFADWLAEAPPAQPVTPEETDLPRLRAFAAHLARGIGREPGLGGFRDDRRPRAERAGDARWRGHRAYNKRFRFLQRFEAKLDTYARERRLWEARLAGKSGLVVGITAESLRAAPHAAAFVAYYAARKARRSEFTISGQSRAFDTIAEALLLRCTRDKTTDWGLVARVYPSREVLARLDAAEIDRLIAAWIAVLAEIAGQLEAAWRDGGFDLATMVVRRGDDSSTWNLLAQAWNTARTAWFALLAASGQDGLLDAVCPGKVMRLIAGDVAAWHGAAGGRLHPDTQVWAALPKPWQVLRGEAPCGAQHVAEACRAAGLDPVRSGWAEGRVATHGVAFAPTPELVNGVAVASPELALLLRDMRVFSGRPVRPPQGGLFARLKRLWGA